MPASFPLTDSELTALYERIESGELDLNDQDVKNSIASIFKDAPIMFFRRFCSEHIIDKATGEPTPTPDFHREIVDMYIDNRFSAVAAPRGHAKSTITSFAYALHTAIYNKADTIVLISASENQAVQFLERIKNEIESNHHIRAIFGDLKSDKWSATQIKLTNGTTMFAKGRGAQIRGLIQGSSRPDLVIMDDIEDEELVRSELRRSDLEQWLNGSILPGIEPKIGKVIFIGTILHLDSLLNRVLDDELYPDFVSKKYKAIDPESGKPLWPERFSKESLNRIKESYISRHQLAQFYMEYQNDPVAQDNATFRPEYFQFFEELPTLKQSPGGIRHEIYVDMGGGSASKSADPTAIVSLAMDDSNTIYVHDYINKRYGNDLKPFFDDLFNFIAKYDPTKVAFEKTSASLMVEKPLEQEMQKRNKNFSISWLTPTRGSSQSRGNMSDGKYQRIASMEGDFKLGQIKMRKWMSELQEQLLSFPRGQHDDLIDALAYGYQNMDRFANSSSHNQSLKEPEYQPLYPSLGL